MTELKAIQVTTKEGYIIKIKYRGDSVGGDTLDFRVRASQIEETRFTLDGNQIANLILKLLGHLTCFVTFQIAVTRILTFLLMQFGRVQLIQMVENIASSVSMPKEVHSAEAFAQSLEADFKRLSHDIGQEMATPVECTTDPRQQHKIIYDRVTELMKDNDLGMRIILTNRQREQGLKITDDQLLLNQGKHEAFEQVRAELQKIFGSR